MSAVVQWVAFHRSAAARQAPEEIVVRFHAATLTLFQEGVYDGHPMSEV